MTVLNGSGGGAGGGLAPLPPPARSLSDRTSPQVLLSLQVSEGVREEGNMCVCYLMG